MPRLLIGILSAVVLLVSACGGSSSERSVQTGPTGTSSGPAADSPSTDESATTAVTPVKPEHGIVVASEYDGIIEIGMVNPVDGSYAVENTFNVGDFAKGPNEPDVTSAVGFSMVVSPDRKRVMAQREVNGDFHTGWIDSDGEFVDITAATLGERNDFSGPISSRGLGFNRQGNFHYGTSNGDVMEVWSLPAGQTTGATLIDTVGLLTRYRFDADGALQFALSGTCDDFAAYSWMGDWYLYSDGNQIYKGPRVPGPAGACGDEGQPMLPETNTALVSDPVGSPDLSEVAFIYTNADDTRSIYVVSADGSGQPRKIDTVEWPSESAHLVGWV